MGRTIGIVLGTILLVTVLTSAIFVGIFMTYVNTSLKGHVEVDMSEYDQKVSTELYYQDPDTKELVMYQTLFGDENRIWVDFDSIPKNLRNATIAIEDKRFESHHGVDWHGTVRPCSVPSPTAIPRAAPPSPSSSSRTSPATTRTPSSAR